MRFHLETAPTDVTLQRQYDGLMTALWATVGVPTKVVRVFLGTGDDGEAITRDLRAYVQAQTNPSDRYAFHVRPDGPRELILWLQGPRRPVTETAQTAPTAIESTSPTNEPFDLRQPISVLPLTMRAYNALQKAHVMTVQEVVTLTPRQVLRIKNLGRDSLQDIQTVLAGQGLTLATTPTRGPQ